MSADELAHPPMASDFTDDEAASGPSREGYRPTMVQNPSAEVREPRAVYRVFARGAG